MDIVGLITSQTLFDILFILVLLAALVVGFIQGAIRRLLGILGMVFAFLLAANLREPVGQFLASYWTQFPGEYSFMIGFLVLFLGLWILLSILIQGFYKRSLIHRSEALDEIAGAALGVLEAVLFVGFLGFIGDSYFRLASLAVPAEVEWLRTAWQAWDLSRIAGSFRELLTPAALAVVGWLVPDGLEALYRR